MTAKRFFITGTGTDVGKTIITAGIATAAIAAGLKTAIIKPVQTGTDDYPSDPSTISKLVPGLVSLPEAVAIPFRYRLAASPHLAAAQENRSIIMDEIVASCVKAVTVADAELALFEGAGGLYVPLNEQQTMLDLIKQLACPAILVADAGLGGINHAMLSIMVMRQYNIPIAGIVFNRYYENSIIHADNIKTISRLSGIPILAVIPTLQMPVTSAGLRQAFSQLIPFWEQV